MRRSSLSIHSCVLSFCLPILLLTLPALASDTEYIFRWAPGDNDFHIVDEDAGKATDIEIRFDTVSLRLTFEVTIEPPTTNPADWLARALVLVLSPGPYPMDGGSEYAVFYFDATDINNPILSVYPYNANECCQDSFSFSTPDKICTSANNNSCPGWAIEVAATNLANGSRLFRFVVDTAFINNFTPSISNPNAIPWKGTGFNELIGVWLTPFGHPDVAFTYDSEGFISNFEVGPPGAHHLGFYDGSNMTTVRESDPTPTPTPPATPTPDCDREDITGDLAAVDSTTDQQAHQVRVLTSKYVRAAKGTSLEADARKLRKHLNAEANELYNLSWTLLWTAIPSTITTCTNAQFCVQLSHSSNVAEVDKNSAQLLELAEEARAELAAIGRKTRKAQQTSVSLRKKNQSLIAGIPTVTTVCN